MSDPVEVYRYGTQCPNCILCVHCPETGVRCCGACVGVHGPNSSAVWYVILAPECVMTECKCLRGKIVFLFGVRNVITLVGSVPSVSACSHCKGVADCTSLGYN